MIRKFVHRYPFWAFTIAAYAFSWTAWVIAFWMPAPSISLVLYHIAGFGPLFAALFILKLQGRSLRRWLRSLFKWRLHPGWYLFALGWPILLVAIVSLLYSLLGDSLDFTSLSDHLVSYLPYLLFLALVGGGNEEPGWRGLGLPTLQQSRSPLAATCILGVVWALWHLPLLATNPDVVSGAIGLEHIILIAGVTLISIATHAFWYTWLMNRTGSVLLCVLLHASYNAANRLLLFVPETVLQGSSYRLLLTLMTLVLITSVVALLVRTKGQLGANHHCQFQNVG
jgi:membrane protease YdiL (CAAX protease family)